MNIEDLTVLIPTHKRPELFYRCFEKVYHEKIKIIVNNDSKDINRPVHANCRCYFDTFDNLTRTYASLISKVQTSWFWILEDDDIPLNALKAFMKTPEPSLDVQAICGSYLRASGKSFTDRIEKFNIESSEFQLSQCIFRNQTFNFTHLYDHCNGDCVFNDYYFFKENVMKYKVLNDIFFIQTTDGKDNISFKEYTNLDKCTNCKYSLNYF